MKVLIGVDGSKIASHAVRFVGRLLSPKVDDLLLAYSPPAFRLASKTLVPEHVLEHASNALADTVFREAADYLSPEMWSVTERITLDELPADGLIRMAGDADVDLIVVGSQAAKRKFPYVLGSTARTVIHHTGRPVLVARGRVKLSSEPLKVIVACDEERWTDATGVLREFSWPTNTAVKLYHVVESFGDDMLDALADAKNKYDANASDLVSQYLVSIENRKAEATQRLETQRLHGPDLIRNAEVEVDHGEIVDKLVEKVEQDDADLLVLSSRRLGVLGRLLGSATESLLTHCPCSILIVHADQPSDPSPEINSEVVANIR